MRREIDKKRRHYHLAKTSMLSLCRRRSGHQRTRDPDRRFENRRRRGTEPVRSGDGSERKLLREVLTYRHPVPSRNRILKRCVAKMAEVFSTHDAKLVEESYNMLNAWIAMVPGNYAHNFRSLLLLNTNYADMSFLFAPATGSVRNAI